MITDKDEYDINIDKFDREEVNLISMQQTNTLKKAQNSNTIQSPTHPSEYPADEDVSSTAATSQSNGKQSTAPVQSSPSLTPVQSPTDIPSVTPTKSPSDVPTNHNPPLPATTTIHDTKYNFTKREMEILFQSWKNSTKSNRANKYINSSFDLNFATTP